LVDVAKIEKFEDINCWKEARVLVKLIYLECENGKIARDFDTKSQLKRATLSIMKIIAEGFARKSNIEFIRFLDIANASAAEVKSIFYVLLDINYLDEKLVLEYQERVDTNRKLISGLIRYLKTKL
jgi:four helix bundle protein